MDDACMKTAAKNGFWLLITAYVSISLLAVIFTLIHSGLASLFLNFCCEYGFNIVETTKAIFWLCIFNVVFSLFISIQTDVQ
jgi:hypothetical protein